MPADRNNTTSSAPATVTVLSGLSVRVPPAVRTSTCDSNRIRLSFRLPDNVIRPSFAVKVRERLADAVTDTAKPSWPGRFAVNRPTMTPSAAEANYSRENVVPSAS